MKVVIAGSAKLQTEIGQWIEYWNNQPGCEVLDQPKKIPTENFEQIYPEVYRGFYKNIPEADIFFVANENKDDIIGYIGASTFAELNFAIAQKIVNQKNIKIILAHLPAPEVQCYNEIILWLKLGWIEILN